MFRFSYYTLPIGGSLLLHGLLIFLVIKSWEKSAEKPDFRKPHYVQAKLVELKTQAPKRVEAAPKVNKVDLTAKANEDAAQKLREQAAKEEAQRAEQALIEKQKAEQKAAEKQAQEKATAEKARQEAEAKKKAEQDARKRQQDALENALREEEMMLAEQAESQVVNSYKGVIMERIAQKWSRPPSARNGMQCELVIQLVPTGKIISVNVVASSGNSAFDRSAEQAVRAVDQISELQGMDPVIFDRNFRTIHLLFRPEDRRL